MADEKQVELTLEELLPAELPAPVFRDVELDKLVFFDAPPPTREFVESVKRFGVLETVVLIENDETGELTVASGRRRVQAARSVGIKKLRCKIYRASANYQYVLTLVANEQRKPNPLADFLAIERVMKANPGCTEQLIVKATGMQIGTIRQRMRFAALIAPLREALEKGIVSVNIAADLARLPASVQEQLADRLPDAGTISAKDIKEVRQARAVVAAEALPDSLFATPSADAAAGLTIQKLQDVLASCPLASSDPRKVVKTGSAKAQKLLLTQIVNWWSEVLVPMLPNDWKHVEEKGGENDGGPAEVPATD